MQNKKIYVNVRSLSAGPLTGVQRYADELLKRFGDEVVRLAPLEPLDGLRGHTWEQFVLPRLVSGGVLWSPANTGPITVSKQVVTIHDASVIDHPEWFDKKFAAWYKILLPKLTKSARYIITDSGYSKRRLIENFPYAAHKIIDIPLGVDERFFARDNANFDDAMHRLELNKRYILAIGSIEPRKNLRTLFDAWKDWQSRPDDVQLVVAGGAGKVFSGLGYETVPQGVKLLGRVEDNVLPTLYRGALAFVFPSLYEGFGLPPLEAMATGTAVICSNAASLPEVIGSAALTVDPLDKIALSAALDQITSNQDLRLKLQSDGIIQAKKFTWDATYQLTKQVLSSLSSKPL